MAESEAPQHIQFGDDIHPVKTTGSSRVYPKERLTPSVSEKPTSMSYDHRDEEEQNAAQIADADMNRKKKQVSLFRFETGFARLLSVAQPKSVLTFFLDLLRMDVDVARIPK